MSDVLAMFPSRPFVSCHNEGWHFAVGQGRLYNEDGHGTASIPTGHNLSPLYSTAILSQGKSPIFGARSWWQIYIYFQSRDLWGPRGRSGNSESKFFFRLGFWSLYYRTCYNISVLVQILTIINDSESISMTTYSIIIYTIQKVKDIKYP